MPVYVKAKTKFEQEGNISPISTLHRVLGRFVMSVFNKSTIAPRKELNVLCPVSNLQRDLYLCVIHNNIAKLRDSNFGLSVQSKKRCRGNNSQDIDEDYYIDDVFSEFEGDLISEDRQSRPKITEKMMPYVCKLINQDTLMTCKEIVDHPYMVHFPRDPAKANTAFLVNDDLVLSSGKMMVLDMMLSKLKEQGHKVLIFSTLFTMLDIIEDFMVLRKYTYRRLDGRDSLDMRYTNIDEFNNEPDILAFLLTTKHGGLGLKVTAADTVIFFDRDWNPLADIQAQDHCHKIWNTTPVMVYTLVAKNTIDERILTWGEDEGVLIKMIMKGDILTNLNYADRKNLEFELRNLRNLFDENSLQDGYDYSEIPDLDQLLDRSDLDRLTSEWKNMF